MPSDINVNQFLMMMAAVVICITIHEFAHAYSALRAGDDTAKLKGRVSLNPIDHLDLFGTIMIVVSSLAHFGIGWGKPVPVNPNRMRHPRWDNLKVSLWGPLSNILTAAVAGLILRVALAHVQNSYVPPSHVTINLLMFVEEITLVSVSLAMFNLIPIMPLDGSHILSALLPYESARRYDMFMARYGMIVFLGLIFAGSSVLPQVIGPPARLLLHLFTGLNY